MDRTEATKGFGVLFVAAILLCLTLIAAVFSFGAVVPSLIGLATWVFWISLVLFALSLIAAASKK
jgi:uncharacterized membrane protein YtjA (UPF0391 family)